MSEISEERLKHMESYAGYGAEEEVFSDYVIELVRRVRELEAALRTARVEALRGAARAVCTWCADESVPIHDGCYPNWWHGDTPCCSARIHSLLAAEVKP